MKNRIYLTFISLMLLLFSSQVLAHTVESGGGLLGRLMHIFTGEHVLMLALVGVCAVFANYLYRRLR